MYDEGKLKAIGISNFYPDRMVDIASFARIRPMVNQVETHVLNQQTEAKKWMDKYGVQIEAWTPFGEGRGGLFINERLAAIAALDTATSSFFSHYDPNIVEWFVNMVKERKKQHDSSKEKKNFP